MKLLRKLRNWWSLRREIGAGGMSEGSVGVRLYGIYRDRRRGVTTVNASYLAAQSITSTSIRVPT